MELKLSGRIAEDLARERHHELLERSLNQARLAQVGDRKDVASKQWQRRVWRLVIRRVAHAVEG